MRDEKLVLMAEALDAYFSGQITSAQVPQFTETYDLSQDTKPNTKKKYYIFDNGDYIQLSPLDGDNPLESGWLESIHITGQEFVRELKRLTCHHPHCNENNPCRSSKRRSGGTMCCTSLVDTEFIGHVCPFFITEKEYNAQFWRTYTAEKPLITGNSWRSCIRIKPGKKGGGENGTSVTA